MTLSNSLFYVELAERCFSSAAHCDTSTGASGLRKLGQHYLNLAKAERPRRASDALPVANALASRGLVQELFKSRI